MPLHFAMLLTEIFLKDLHLVNIANIFQHNLHIYRHRTIVKMFTELHMPDGERFNPNKRII